MRIAERKESPIIGLTGMGGGLTSYILYGSSGSGVYEISRSLRFNSSDSAYLYRTPSTVGNRTNFTWSGWVKRTNIGGVYPRMFGNYTGGSYTGWDIEFNNNDQIDIHYYNGSSYTVRRTTNAVYRDPSAWYHIVVAVQTVTSTDQIKLWVNGVEVTDFATNSNATIPSDIGYLTNINTAVEHRIGYNYSSSDFYLADVHYVDGATLTASDFGEADSYGIWNPKEFTGNHNGGTTTVNNGTVWSNYIDVAADGSYPLSNLFGGTIGSGYTNGTRATSGTMTFDISSLNISVTNVRLSTFTAGTPSTFTLNGTTLTGYSDGDSTIVVAVNGQLNTIAWSYDSGSGPYSYMRGIEVDLGDGNGYQLLVDGHNTSGANGFHLKFDDTSSSTSIGTDSSTNNNNLTPSGFSIALAAATTAGDPTVGSSDIPFSSGYSVDLDGNDAVYFPGPGTVSGDFTAEIFMKASSYAGIQRILSANEGSQGSEYFNMRAYNGNTEFVFKSGVSASGTNLPTDQWNHIAMTRSGSEISYYLNGSRWATSTSSDSINITTLCVGIGYGSEYFTGQVSNARFVNGQALYTGASYTVPTATLTTTSQGATASNVRMLGVYTATVTDNGGVIDQAITDSFIDSPSNYSANSGNNGGNYCTWNPLNKHSNSTLSDGNLIASSSDVRSVLGTIAFPDSGKYYAEFTVNGTASGYPIIGIIANNDSAIAANQNPDTGVSYFQGGSVNLNGSSTGTTLTALSTGDVVGVAYDAATRKVWFSLNGSFLNSGDPAAGTNQITTLTENINGYSWGCAPYSTATVTLNAGQRSFRYTPPTDYVALCTQNLPTPTILKGSEHVGVSTWTGTDITAANTITGLGFSPDLIWAKSRSHAYNNKLTDTVRGGNKSLTSNNTVAEVTDEQYGYIDTFNSDGFTSTPGSGDNDYYNGTGKTYVAWTWNAGSNSNKTYTVKVVSDSGNKYRFDDFGTSAVTLELEEGSTYVFDSSDSSVDGHPFVLGTSANSNEYSTGVTYTLDGTDVTYSAYTSGFATATTRKLTITVPASAPTLYYWCSLHSGMGGQVNTNSTAGSSNFDGSIQTTVKANQSAGFSIMTLDFPTYSGTSSVGHGLNAAPHWWMMKDRDSADGWYVGHISLGAGKYVRLESSNAEGSSASLWDNTLPSSSVIYNNGISMSGAGSYVMYAWAPVSGYSAFGSFSGNSSNPGPFRYCGFRPKWFMLKGVSANSRDWIILDAERDPINTAEKYLYPNSSGVEQSYDIVDFLSNGFQMRYSGGLANQSGETYIWAAFAENPFRVARAR